MAGWGRLSEGALKQLQEASGVPPTLIQCSPLLQASRAPSLSGTSLLGVGVRAGTAPAGDWVKGGSQDPLGDSLSWATGLAVNSTYLVTAVPVSSLSFLLNEL